MKAPILFAAALAASAGLAQAPPGPNGSAHTAYDPNEMICQRIEVIGSRLHAQRLCQTRQQWDEMRRTSRSGTEMSQTRVCPNPGGCGR